MYNKKMFAQAGIARVPDDADELGQRRREAEGSGRAVPALDPDGRHRGRRHALVPAHPGDGRPAVRRQPQAAVRAARARPATRRCSWRSTRSRTAGSRPGRCRSNDDVALNKFTARPERDPAGHRPGQPADRERPDASRASPATRSLALVPGVSGPGGSFGLPEGLSIPVTAKHKAAAAAFIEWWEQRRRTRSRSTRRRAACPAAPRRSSSSPPPASCRAAT